MGGGSSGFGGGKSVLIIPGARCQARFASNALPHFVVRLRSQRIDPHSVIQFFKVQSKSKSRELVVAKVGLLSGSAVMDNAAVPFNAKSYGESSVEFAPGVSLPIGEYVFSLLDSRDAFCFGVD